MLAVVVICAAAIAVGCSLLGWSRRGRFNEVERFHRARAMTSEWSRSASTRPLITPQDSAPEVEQRTRARAGRRS